MTGLVAVVTGGRIKIGYQTCLKLLRCGATVVAVTRFPQNAARKYLAEADSSNWAHRLHLYGLDLRHMPSVEAFLKHCVRHYPRIDILINNAAQTVRRPAAYYLSLVEKEMTVDPKVVELVKIVGEDPHKPLPAKFLQPFLAAPPTQKQIKDSPKSSSPKSAGTVSLPDGATSLFSFTFFFIIYIYRR